MEKAERVVENNEHFRYHSGLRMTVDDDALQKSFQLKIFKQV